MNDPGNAENMDKAAQEARAAVESGENIRDAMRDITLAALSRGQIDAEGMNRVVRSVMQGASQGVTEAGEKSRLALSDAFAGIDDALAKSAEASKLAIEEAAGRLRDYGKRDLERAFSNMQALEAIFVDTLKEVADDAAGATQDILQGLLRHARDSGTAAGKAATAAIAGLEQKLGRTLREIAGAGRDAALGTGAQLAEAAAGFLAGIAAALSARSNSAHDKKK